MLKFFCQLLASLQLELFFLNTGLINCLGYLLKQKCLHKVVWWIISYIWHICQTTNVNARWGQSWLIQPQSFPEQVSGWMLCSCSLKEEIQSKFSVLNRLGVIAYGFTDSHKDMIVNKFRTPTTKHFFQWGKCETFEGGIFVVYWWWMQRNDVRN